jgi:predicted nuclease with TOPRIM domain
MDLKQAYADKMDAQLRQWQAKIDALQAKADQAEAEQKIRYHEQIELLRTKQQQLEEKLEQLRSAGADAWEELKGGVELAWHELETAAQRAAEKFK